MVLFRFFSITFELSQREKPQRSRTFAFLRHSQMYASLSRVSRSQRARSRSRWSAETLQSILFRFLLVATNQIDSDMSLLKGGKTTKTDRSLRTSASGRTHGERPRLSRRSSEEKINDRSTCLWIAVVSHSQQWTNSEQWRMNRLDRARLGLIEWDLFDLVLSRRRWSACLSVCLFIVVWRMILTPTLHTIHVTAHQGFFSFVSH